MDGTKMITIFNQKLCGYLMMKGFVLVAMSKNKHCTNKNVFFFNNSEELQESINEFTKRKMENK